MRAWIPIISLTLVLTARAGDKPMKTEDVTKVADFEKKVECKAFPATETGATVSFSPKTASQGKKSLRFEFDADGKTPASLAIPFAENIEGYDALAFDFYCERDNGAKFTVSLLPKNDLEGASSYYARLKLSDGRDGWTSVRLVKDRGLRYRGKDIKRANWAEPRALSFGLGTQMKGKVVFYLDNIRFEKVDDAQERNLIYNPSVEVATNPDVPDGWRRDFDVPPFGEDVWTLDDTTAWHGKKSIRIGAKGKTAIAWGRFIHLVAGETYVFSVYLKSDKPGTKVSLLVSGLAKPNSKEVDVGTEWKRFSLTGKASRGRTGVVVKLLSDAILWIDAAQLEAGIDAGPFVSPTVEDEGLTETSDKKAKTLESLNKPPKSGSVKRADAQPIIDGDLSDPCWKAAEPLRNFVVLNDNKPAANETEALAVFDDEALYIAVRAKDGDMTTVRKFLETAKKPWSSDCAELFLDLDHDRLSYYHFAANANGDKYFARCEGPKRRMTWEADWSVAGKILDDAWTLEFKIPFSSLDANPALEFGDTIGLNVCRTKKTAEGKGGTRSSSWSFSHGSFHDARAFGELKGFDPKVMDPYRFTVPSLSWRRGVARAAIKNNTGEDADLTLTFLADRKGVKTASAPVTERVPAGETIDVSASLPLVKDGYYTVKLEAKDGDGRRRILTNSLSVKVSGTNLFDFDGPEYDLYTKEKETTFRCFVETGEEQCGQLRVVWTVTNQNGGKSPSGEFVPRPGINRWNVSLANLDDGDYLVKAELKRGEKTVELQEATFEKRPPAKQEVKINRWGRFLTVNGEPFLPFGFFENSIAKRVPLEQWDAILKDLADNHCDSVLAYTGMRNDLTKALGPYLDAAEKHGIRVFVHLQGMMAWHIPKYARNNDRFRDEASALAALEKLILKFKDHPAVLGWCTYDEPGNRPNIFTKDVVAKSYQLIKNLDPYHPCFCSHLNHMGDSEIYGPASDVALMPFLERGGRYDHLFQEFWDAGFPLFTNSPCYGAAGGTCREPTPAEQRVRTYKAIVMGARGVQYYTYRCASQVLWRSVGEIGEELDALSPALLTPDDRLRVDFSPPSPDVRAVLKSDGKNYYLLAVNTSTQPIKGAFNLIDVPTIESVEPLYGSPSADIDRDAKRLRLETPPQSVAIYRLTENKEE